MENASKALIIAGAILISILLISLGIMLFNSSKGVTDQADEVTNALSTSANQQVNALQTTLNSISF